MKSLESKAEKYDKGIKSLTLGRLPKIKQEIVENYLNEGENLLDIGMGTGTLAIIAAKKGVKVTGIDYSEKMLDVARKNLKNENLSESVKIIKMPVIDLDEAFPNNSFDKVTATLSFSELYQKEQEFCLNQIYRILKENGEFIIVDEVKPKKFWKKVVYFFVRMPISLLNFIKAHISTSPLTHFEQKLKKHNFMILEEKLYLLDTLKLIQSKKIKGDLNEHKK